jgi:hypothetical protein
MFEHLYEISLLVKTVFGTGMKLDYVWDWSRLSLYLVGLFARNSTTVCVYNV